VASSTTTVTERAQPGLIIHFIGSVFFEKPTAGLLFRAKKLAVRLAGSFNPVNRPKEQNLDQNKA
jgi:hypothetical protein